MQAYDIQFNSFMDSSLGPAKKHEMKKGFLSVVHVFSISVNWPHFELKLPKVEVMISVSDFLKLEKEIKRRKEG